MALRELPTEPREIFHRRTYKHFFDHGERVAPVIVSATVSGKAQPAAPHVCDAPSRGQLLRIWRRGSGARAGADAIADEDSATDAR